MRHLLSFADSRMSRTLERLSRQAVLCNFFDTVHLLDESDLSIDFREKFKDKLIHGSKGFGYWSWKPEVVRQTLDLMNEHDTMIYIDAGCHLNKNGVWRLSEYFNLLDNCDEGILAFQAKPPTLDISPLGYDGRKLFEQPNYRWIKGDLFDYFGVRDDQKYTKAQAIGAGIILLKKCDQALAFIKEWQLAIEEDFGHLDDTLSKSNNLDGFIEHRHDQAIFSLLCLKHKIPTLSAYEYWYPKKNHNSGLLEPDWEALKKFPIHAKRDRNYGLITNLKQQIDRLPKRAYSMVRSIFR